LVSVSDLTDYDWCPRSLWLRHKLGIRRPAVYSRGVAFHVLIHGMFEQVKRALASDIPGRIVATELILPSKASPDKVFGLTGRIDVLREERDGYIVQDEKYTSPPKTGRIYPGHKLQLDAYCFLAERDGYSPVKSAIIIYDDLRPREVAPDTERVPDIIMKVHDLLRNRYLPKTSQSKCENCSYCPLCAILPESGLTPEQILVLRRGQTTVTETATLARSKVFH